MRNQGFRLLGTAPRTASWCSLGLNKRSAEWHEMWSVSNRAWHSRGTIHREWIQTRRWARGGPRRETPLSVCIPCHLPPCCSFFRLLKATLKDLVVFPARWLTGLTFPRANTLRNNVFMDCCAARNTGSCRLRASASIMLIPRCCCELW